MAKTRKYEAVREAVVRACAALLFGSDASLKDTEEGQFVLRTALNAMVWKYSEATPHGRGKYKSCAIWSKVALEELRKDKLNYWRRVVLEHVVTRRFLVERLIKCKETTEIRSVLAGVITCVIHRDEHKYVHKPKDWLPTSQAADGWWERYLGTPIELVKGPQVAN